MTQFLKILLFVLLVAFTQQGIGASEVEKESFYHTHLENLLIASPMDQETFDDYVTRLSELEEWQIPLAIQALAAVNTDSLDRIPLREFAKKLESTSLKIAIEHTFFKKQVNYKYLDDLLSKGFQAEPFSSEQFQACELMKERVMGGLYFYSRPELAEICYGSPLAITPPTLSQLEDLVRNTPEPYDYQDGRFLNAPKIFQFCRTHRSYTCLMALQDANGKWVRYSNGKLWHQQKLALSRKGNKYNEFGGDTPAGIYTIEGVMPSADKQQVYGRYRRLIMQFIDHSSGERKLKELLPLSHSRSNWWKESTIARDMGRDLFRVHGTLRKNQDPNSTFYPFYPTMGCIATKEGRYGGTDYKEQRTLLDVLMKASGMPAIYQNEERILAMLYVVEIDRKQAPVTLSDVARFGLK